MTLTNFPHKLRIYIRAQHMWRRNWYLTGAKECVWLYNFYFGPSVKFTLPEGCPPQHIFPVPLNSLCISSWSIRPPPWLSCAAFLRRLSRLVFVFCEARLVSFGSYFVKVPDSVVWNKWERWTRGLVPRADVSLRLTPEAVEVMMRKPCSEKKNKKTKKTCRGVRTSWRATQKRDPVITRSWPLATAT